MKIKSIFLALLITFSISYSSAQAEYFKDVVLTGTAGIWTDTRSYTSLDAALIAIGTDPQTLVIASPVTTTVATINANTRLKFIRDGSINNSGTLTINTPNIEAGHQRIFTGTGAVRFTKAIEKVIPQWFGAIADDALDDSVSIQAAIDSVSTDGGVVFLPPGTYRLTTGLEITSDSTIIRGSGRDLTILTPTAGVTNITGIHTYNANYCGVHDLAVIGFTSITSEHMGIHIEAGFYCTVSGIYASGNDDSGIRIGYDRLNINLHTYDPAVLDPEDPSLNNVWGGHHQVFNNIIDGTLEGHGIELIYPNHTICYGNRITNCRDFGIRVVGTFDSLVYGNWVLDCGWAGIVVTPGGNNVRYTKNNRRSKIYGNWVRHTSDGYYRPAGYRGIILGQASLDCTIENNHIISPAIGVVAGDDTSQGISISHNAVINAFGYDFYNCVIKGNQIVGHRYGIAGNSIGGYGIKITDNVISSPLDVGIYMISASNVDPYPYKLEGGVIDGNTILLGTRIHTSFSGISLAGNQNYISIGRNKFVHVGSTFTTFYPYNSDVDSALTVKCDVLNVSDIGAIGDGVVDDKVSIDAAIRSATNLPSIRSLYFPAGTYNPGAGFITSLPATCEATGAVPVSLIGGLPRKLSYAGNPENNVTAPIGSICSDTTNAVLYFKVTGTGNTGWKVVPYTP